MKFKGKIAAWYWIVLIIVNGMCLFHFDYLEGREAEVAVYILIADFVLLPPVIRNYVVLTQSTLTICFGFGKDEIKIKDIVEIKEKHSPATTTSFDRLVVTTKEKDYTFAVKKKEEFLKEVKNTRRKIIITRKVKKAKSSGNTVMSKKKTGNKEKKK